jgi:hypothetical protein
MMTDMALADPSNVLRVDPSARVLTGPELAAYWHRCFLSPEQRLDDTVPERRQIAWRILREFARVRGLVRVGEPLADATKAHPSPWSSPFQVFPLKSVDLHDPMVLSCSREPIALLPLNDEEQVERFCDFARTLGLRLHVHADDKGSAAFDLLSDPDLAREAWPRPDEILEVEALEQKRVLRMILAQPELQVCSVLGQQGYREHEIMDILALAKWAAKQRIASDPAADRALMILRLQEEINVEEKSTAKAALLRLMASVQGLLQSEENGPKDKDVGGMVRDVMSLPTGAEPAGLLEPPVEPIP